MGNFILDFKKWSLTESVSNSGITDIVRKVISNDGGSKDYTDLFEDSLGYTAVGILHFTKSGLGNLYESMDTVKYFSKSQSEMIDSIDTYRGHEMRDLDWKKGMSEFLYSNESKTVQDAAAIRKFKPNLDRYASSWTTDREHAIGISIMNSSPSDFKSLGKKYNWDAEKMMFSYCKIQSDRHVARGKAGGRCRTRCRVLGKRYPYIGDKNKYYFKGCEDLIDANGVAVTTVPWDNTVAPPSTNTQVTVNTVGATSDNTKLVEVFKDKGGTYKYAVLPNGEYWYKPGGSSWKQQTRQSGINAIETRIKSDKVYSIEMLSISSISSSYNGTEVTDEPNIIDNPDKVEPVENTKPTSGDTRRPSQSSSASAPMAKRHGRPHHGYDISADSRIFRKAGNVPLVICNKAGTVTCSKVVGGYGNLVEIKHGENDYSAYAHLDSSRVKKGERIEVGDVIGVEGTTGHSDGNHVHFEFRVDHVRNKTRRGGKGTPDVEANSFNVIRPILDVDEYYYYQVGSSA